MRERKEGIILGPERRAPLLLGEENKKGFYPAFAFVLMGDGEGPSDILPCWCWARKFQAG